jgi:signal transduction histidine kinase
MISLIPPWAHHYNEFWDLLKGRNVWFIKLRYSAVGMLLLFLFVAKFILGIRFSSTQSIAIFLVTGSILVYNILLHYTRRYVRAKPDRFNPVHHSLIQMILDIIALFLLVYFTGSIESPLFLLFVFHMIIGSLILPGIVVYSIATVVVILFTSGVFLEYYGILYHHTVAGFLTVPVYTDFNYVISFTVFFAFLIFVSVLLTNRIARELYRNEELLLESLDKLNKAEEEKQKYIIGVVHELKSPVGALLSFLDLILQKYVGPLNEKVEEKLNSAKERAVEAIDLINNILRISKLRLTHEIIKGNLKIKEIVCSVLEKQKAEIESKKITVKLTDDRLLRTPVQGDEFLIEMALSNIIANAVKYAGIEGKIEILISELNEGINLSVSDNGIGIPVDDQENIFKDFYRASNIKKRGYEGAGLGLSIVKQIMLRHGGDITVESPGRMAEPEKPGTTINIFIPF